MHRESRSKIGQIAAVLARGDTFRNVRQQRKRGWELVGSLQSFPVIGRRQAFLWTHRVNMCLSQAARTADNSILLSFCCSAAVRTLAAVLSAFIRRYSIRSPKSRQRSPFKKVPLNAAGRKDIHRGCQRRSGWQSVVVLERSTESFGSQVTALFIAALAVVLMRLCVHGHRTFAF